MVTLTTPKGNKYYNGEEWVDIEDYSGWGILLIHFIGLGGYLLLESILVRLWPLFKGVLVGSLILLGIFIIGLVRG